MIGPQQWMFRLTVQQQSVLLLASRGPDGVAKSHPCKEITRVYRAVVFNAAKFGRPLRHLDEGDTFMSLRPLQRWSEVCRSYFDHVDSLPHHYHLHLMHGCQIIGYKHPDLSIAGPLQLFFYRACDDMHLTPESEEDMDKRLSDWNQEFWNV